MNHISSVYPEVKTIAINEAEGQSFFKRLVGFFWSDAAANSDDPAQKRMAEEMKLRQDFIEQDQKDIEKRREDLLKAQHEARMEALKAQHKLKKMQLDAKNKEKVEYFKQKVESLKRQRENMASSMFPLSESTKQAMLNKLQGEIDSLDSLGAKKTMTAEENAAFNVFNAMVKKDNDGNVITNEYGDPELVDSKDYQTNLAKNLTLPPMNMTKEEAEKEAERRVSAAIGESGKALNAMTPEESKTLFNELREMGNTPNNKELSERLNKINDLQNNSNFTKMEEAKAELANIDKLQSIKNQIADSDGPKNISFVEKVTDDGKTVLVPTTNGKIDGEITDADTLKKLGLKPEGVPIPEGADDDAINKLKETQEKKAKAKVNTLLGGELADLTDKKEAANNKLTEASNGLKDDSDNLLAELGIKPDSDEGKQITKHINTLTDENATPEEKEIAQASLKGILDNKKESIKNEIEENKSALAQMQSRADTAGAALRNKDTMSDDELEDELRNNSVETKEWPDMNAIDDNDSHKKAYDALTAKAESFPEDSEERAKYLAAANAVKQDYISSQTAEEPSFKVGDEEIKGKLVKTKDGFAIKTPDGETKALSEDDAKAALQKEAEYRDQQKKIAASKARADVECHVAEDGTIEIMTADLDDNGKPVKDSKPSFISVKGDNINDSNEGNFNKAGDYESKQELEKTDNSEESYTSEDGKERVTKYKENGEWKYKKETKAENGEWADDTTTSDDDIKAQFNELKSADDATANDDEKEGKDPSKYWKQRPKKNGKGKTESYYSQGGRGDVSISKKEYLEKVNKYNKKQKSESLQVFINNSLIFESRTNNSGLKDFIKRMIAESKEQSKDEKKQKPESTEPEEINNKGAYKLGNSVFFTITNDDLSDDSKKELDRLSVPFSTVKMLDLSKETPLNIDALADDIRNMLFSKMNDADETLFDNFYMIKQDGGYTVFIGSSLDKEFMKNITKYISDAKKSIIRMATSEEI